MKYSVEFLDSLMKDNMFALVKFEENSQKIYSMKCVKLKENDRCVVKHKGTNYEATLISMQESKDYLEKYANFYSSPEIPSRKECNNNSISVDFSDFSIGSDFMDIPSSSSILDPSFRNLDETSPENAHIGGEDPTKNQGRTLRGANSKREERANINSVCASSQRNISGDGDEDEDNITEYDVSPYGSVKRRRWTVTETEVALREFEKNIESGKLPSFKEIQEVKLRCSQLKARSSPQIKTWIHNQLRKKKN